MRCREGQRFLLSSGSIVLAIECGQYLRLGHLIVKTIFDFYGFVRVGQRAIQVRLFSQANNLQRRPN